MYFPNVTIKDIVDRIADPAARERADTMLIEWNEHYGEMIRHCDRCNAIAKLLQEMGAK